MARLGSAGERLCVCLAVVSLSVLDLAFGLTGLREDPARPSVCLVGCRQFCLAVAGLSVLDLLAVLESSVLDLKGSCVE